MYRVLTDCRTEGYSLGDEEFPSVNEAVKAALANNYGNPFYIVQVIDWKAQEVKPSVVIP